MICSSPWRVPQEGLLLAGLSGARDKGRLRSLPLGPGTECQRGHRGAPLLVQQRKPPEAARDPRHEGELRRSPPRRIPPPTHGLPERYAVISPGASRREARQGLGRGEVRQSHRRAFRAARAPQRARGRQGHERMHRGHCRICVSLSQGGRWRGRGPLGQHRPAGALRGPEEGRALRGHRLGGHAHGLCRGYPGGGPVRPHGPILRGAPERTEHRGEAGTLLLSLLHAGARALTGSA
ncbi:MAG: hypothetical protein MZV70_42265 [Desulfobacterales bacterium]|nr:hypothetical protein [Desulfobacterales bacterium]